MWTDHQRLCNCHRALQRIPIYARPIHQPQRVRFQIPPRRRVIIPHPVLVQAGLGLKPLAGEAGIDWRARHRAHTAKRRIAGGPDLDPGGIRRKHGPPDVAGRG
jgi:hypothetical protein